MASAWEAMVGRGPGDFLLPVTCLGFHLYRIISSMASCQQPALLRSQLCHAHLLPEAPTHLQRDPGRSQAQQHPAWVTAMLDHPVVSPGQELASRGARVTSNLPPSWDTLHPASLRNEGFAWALPPSIQDLRFHDWMPLVLIK